MAKENAYWDSSRAQNDVEEFVNEYLKVNFHPPSYREIMAGLEAKSTSGIFKVVATLEKKGRIADRGNVPDNTSRQIVPIWVIDDIKAYVRAGKPS